MTLLIYAVGLATISFQLGRQIDLDIIEGEAEILHSLTVMLQDEVAEDFSEEMLEDPGAQMGVLLKASRFKGVLVARLFTANGSYVAAVPAGAREEGLGSEKLGLVRRRENFAAYHPAMNPADLILTDPDDPAPVVRTLPVIEVVVPLHQKSSGHLLGCAQYFIDGTSVARELRALDRKLLAQSLAVFVLGGVLIAGSLFWVLGRLQRANRQLTRRTRSLLEANRELALISKTSAIGSLTAHLLHELRSHLFGIQSLLSSKAMKEESTAETARASCQRMQGLMSRLLAAVKNDEGTNTHYEVSFGDIFRTVEEQVKSLPGRSGVSLELKIDSPGTVSSRVANLVGIILGHLVQNAVQASSEKGLVRLLATRTDSRIRFEVSDSGKGFPQHLMLWIFKPCASTKEGGSGIGLALCKQLATHLEGSLELTKTGDDGCTFALVLPASAASPETELIDEPEDVEVSI